ncbi:MAG: hypothetical protein V2I24_09200 [Halieaceae bacterium]|nr:hypothetical protein [Halieaceae bacterium]
MKLQRGVQGARIDVLPEVLTWENPRRRVCLWLHHFGGAQSSHTSLEMTRLEAVELIHQLARALAFTGWEDTRGEDEP